MSPGRSGTTATSRLLTLATFARRKPRPHTLEVSEGGTQRIPAVAAHPRSGTRLYGGDRWPRGGYESVLAGVVRDHVHLRRGHLVVGPAAKGFGVTPSPR